MKKYTISGFSDEYAKSLTEQIQGLTKLGIDHMELRFVDGVNVADLTLERVLRIKEELAAAKINISAIGSPLGKISVTDPLDAHLKKAEHVFKIANTLGCRYIRMFSFYIPKDSTREACRDQVLERLSALLDLADQYDVILCHENEHGIYGESPDDCFALLSHFEGRLKCVLDMGNFVLDGYDPMYALSILRPYVAYFHIKDATNDGVIVPAGMGDAKIFDILSAFSCEQNVFVSLEPHLKSFIGLNNLTESNLKHKVHFDSPQDAFSFHANQVKAIVRKIEMKTIKKDKLEARICATRLQMGETAAKDIHDTILSLLAKKDEINMIFAAAPSQNETLAALCSYEDIDWTRINAFHMDEYIGLAEDAPQRFGNYLAEHIFAKKPFRSVSYINGLAPIEEECARYTQLLLTHPIDIVCLGIGENGHIAFNDPDVADFNDTAMIKAVSLDEICRQQQVNDGCFATLADVPKQALTLTIPTLFHADYLFCSVPAKTKAWAVNETMTSDRIDEHCPATIMRLHNNAILYLDQDSASQLL